MSDYNDEVNNNINRNINDPEDPIKDTNNISSTEKNNSNNNSNNYNNNKLIEMQESKFTIDNNYKSLNTESPSSMRSECSDEDNKTNKKRSLLDTSTDNLETDTEVGFDYNKNKQAQEAYQNYMFFIKFIPLVLAVVFYLVSLKSCQKAFFICVNTFERDYLNKIVVPFGVLSAICFYLQFYIIKKHLDISDNMKNKYYLIVVIIMIALFMIDTGAAFDRHGMYNCIIVTLVMSIVYTAQKSFKCCIYLFKAYKKACISTIIILVVINFLIYLNLHGKFDKSCENWDSGFKNSTIDNFNSQCLITPPKVCLMNVMYGFFNYSHWTNSTCKSLVMGRYDIVQEILTDKSAKIIGFPRTNNYDWLHDSARKRYNNKVRESIINMEDPRINQSIKDEIETIVDFNYDPAKVTIDLKRNETLAQMRKVLFEKEDQPRVITKNVLTVYIDSLSRVDFKRKLPETFKFIEQFYRSDKDTDIEAFQFFKYHGVGKYTLLNNVPAFWGTYSMETKYGKFYLDSYKERGYVTGNAQNHCAKETVASDDVEALPYSGYDHELNGFYCDPNNENANNTISNFHGANNMGPRCLYGKHTGEYNMQYALQFFNKYKDNAKLFHLGLMDNHEFTAEGIHLLDNLLAEFLIEFKNQGHLNETTIVFHTDHGHAYFSFYNIVKAQDQTKEVVLPAFFLIMPKNSTNNFTKVRENLIANENSLVSPFTIYNSYKALAGDNSNSATYSKYNIFENKIPRSVNCSQFWDKEYFKIAEYLCRCEK